jgi:hypothetical protein
MASKDTLFRKLDARVPLWPDEPAYALAGRLARRNGVNSLVSFGGDQGLGILDMIYGRRNAEIAALAGADFADIEKATFRVLVSEERVRINDEVLHREDWSYGNLRICPHCLRDDMDRKDSRSDFLPHIRSWWNLTHISVCPIHSIELSDHHLDSLKVDRFCWDIRLAARCQRGANKAVDDTRVESYILGRLGFMPRLPSAILDGLPLWNALRALERIGVAILVGVRHWSPFSNDRDRRKALCAGYTVLSGGDRVFSAFLDTLVASAEVSHGKWGPRVVYGRLYEWLAYSTRDKAYDPLRALISEHALNNFPLAPDDTLFGQAVGRRRIYTLWHASRAIGTVSSSGRRLFKALGHLPPSEEIKPSWKTFLRSQVVHETQEQLRDRMGYDDARAYLGLPRGPMLSLYQEDILKPFLGPSAGVKDIIYRKRELDQFISTVIGRAITVEAAAGNLYNVVEAAKRGQTSTSALVRYLLSGRLKCAGRLVSAKGLMAALVDLREIRVIRKLEFEIQDEQTIDSCRRRLGVTWVVMERLITLDFITVIPTRTGIKNKTRGLVDVQSFDRFVATYVRATEIAAIQRTHVRTLVAELRQRGMAPAIEKKDAGQYFYRRSDLAKARLGTNSIAN